MTRRRELGAKQVCLGCLNSGEDYAGKPCRAPGCKAKPRKKSPRPLLLKQPFYENPLVREVLGSSICRSFELLDICTEEIESAGVHRSMSSEMFKLLVPNEEFKRTTPAVYRNHVRELIERYKADQSLDDGTSAEVLLGLMHASQVAPLNHGGSTLYHRMFQRVLGEDCYRGVLGDIDPPRERWPGEADELEHEARRKVRTCRPRKVS